MPWRGAYFWTRRQEEALGGVGLEDEGGVVAAPGAVVGGAEVDEEAAGNAGHGLGGGKSRARVLSEL